jgi:hypothetical protein
MCPGMTLEFVSNETTLTQNKIRLGARRCEHLTKIPLGDIYEMVETNVHEMVLISPGRAK